jgi:hypothetical protein
MIVRLLAPAAAELDEAVYLEVEAWPGKEPRIHIPPALVRVGLTDEGPVDD